MCERWHWAQVCVCSPRHPSHARHLQNIFTRKLNLPEGWQTGVSTIIHTFFKTFLVKYVSSELTQLVMCSECPHLPFRHWESWTDSTRLSSCCRTVSSIATSWPSRQLRPRQPAMGPYHQNRPSQLPHPLPPPVPKVSAHNHQVKIKMIWIYYSVFHSSMINSNYEWGSICGFSHFSSHRDNQS